MPATPHIVARPHASRAASTAWRITLDVARRLEREVGSESVRLRADPVDGVVAREPRVGRAVVTRALEPLLGEVDRDDPLGTGEPAADDGAEPDEAAAEDDARRAGRTSAVYSAAPIPVARPHANGAQPSSDASGETFASAISGITVYSAKVDVPMKWRIGSPSRERRVVPSGRKPRPCWSRIATHRFVRPLRQWMHSTALGREERDDVVAGPDERDVRADALHDTGALVPEHARHVSGRIGARRRVQVGVAHAARGEPDEHLALLRLGEIELGDDERLPELLEDCGADLHLAQANPRARSRASGRSCARR